MPLVNQRTGKPAKPRLNAWVWLGVMMVVAVFAVIGAISIAWGGIG